ncbi:DEAD/DEAH box helicase [Falsirhodobacter xinxiangensis]|uniref:DEAD/DEAH box helicase n=1 Tax=Falsirhodobacter xinxiangensis TaxID=2530049 RepID=UPI0010AAC503|nr:DEAD/DEAH box helicase [Rhodobacter xinxiangensis]
MTEMTQIAAPLAAALAAKGYESLTQVQEAVLAEEAQGRDVLVSAQTGSGKTVAFGIAMAPELLNGADRLLFADVPLALAIAPTRELALQVARELEWLYGEAGAIIATCVGGMDYRTEKRALDRGAHIVVGTPGRLRDHIERGSLDLSGLRVAVLDEADEMLDLGFRDDLEFILEAAPEDRRTLMFSATVPKEIAALAKDFQNDALRIQTQGEKKQHSDIEYRALNVTSRDKENAIFNLLRFYEAKTAIVFCKTRANVNNLLARMGNRGFQVVALSGELSQQERTHALQALRDGRARVCIATDVAARGIDLPGLELVIHADLPSNSETLLHRSGRTGRAGAKGVSALIVPQAEFRKAQRLLQGAKLVAEWGKAPSADEVQERDDVRILEHSALQSAPGDEGAMAETLLEKFGAETVAAAFVRLWREGRSAPEVLSDAIQPSAPRERGEFGESVWFTLSVGHTGRAEARWLLPKICDAGGITKNDIGAIRVQQDRTFVQIAKSVAGKFGAHQQIEADLEMTRMDGEPTLDRPERAPRKPYEKRDKPAYTPKPSRFVEDEDAPRAPRPPRAEERKPYEKRDDKPRAPRSDKPYAPREDRKPYAPREGAERKWSPEDRKPYAPRGEDARPYARKEEGDDRKPRWKAGDKPEGKFKPKSAGFKSHGGSSDKPARAAGFKSHGDNPKAAPRDARDTSKRFVPPKKK